MDLSVLFDSGDLFGGTYRTDIEVMSNDPTTPLLNIPASITVDPICPDQDKDGYAVCSGACALAGNNRCGDCDDFERGRASVRGGDLQRARRQLQRAHRRESRGPGCRRRSDRRHL